MEDQPGADKPEPHVDPAPDPNPGGADAVVESPEDFPLITPDQPSSAQVDTDVVPDEIHQPEDKQQEGDSSDDEDGDSSEPS